MKRARFLRAIATPLGVLAALALGVGGLTAFAADADDPFVREILSGIDFVPAKDTLDEVLGGQAEGDLVDIARNNGTTNDPGVRIRAYRALSNYPSDEVREALQDAVEEHSQLDGLETLYTRAAVEALAVVGGPDSVSDIAPLLGHGRRDVRAAAARALGVSGSPNAVPFLRARLQVETVIQVRLAIDQAIRELTGAPSPN